MISLFTHWFFKYKLFILTSICLLFAVPLPANAADNRFSIMLTTDKFSYTVGEPVPLKIEVKNNADYNKCMIGHKQIIQNALETQYGIEITLISGNMSVSDIYRHKPKQEHAVQSLKANDSKEFIVNLIKRFGELSADKYIVFARYRPKIHKAAYDIMLSKKQECVYWSKYRSSKHLTFNVKVQNQQTEIANWLSKWRSENIKTKWRALLWLKDNVLKAGMTPDKIQELLGKPSSVYLDGSWVYIVSKTGISISFKKNVVDRVSLLES